MIESPKKLIYKAFGLSLISDISLPELPRQNDEVSLIDVEIIIKDLSKLWLELSDEVNAFVIKENFVMFQVPNIATFLIQEGSKITVSPIKTDEEDHIRLYILGTCMGAILMQRKVLPLHGSAVAINGKAYAFMGNSGAGKSTTASALLKQGYLLLSDDVIAVSISNKGIPFVTPSFPHQKLWDDSLDKLGMSINNYHPIYGRENKYSVPATNYLTEPLPLGGVFELIKSENKELKIQRIEGLERFYTLYYNTYQNCFLQNLGLMDWHFNITKKVIDNKDIYQIQRPASGTSPSVLVEQVLKIIGKGD